MGRTTNFLIADSSAKMRLIIETVHGRKRACTTQVEKKQEADSSGVCIIYTLWEKKKKKQQTGQQSFLQLSHPRIWRQVIDYG